MAPLGPMPPNPVGWRECAVDTVFEFLALGFIVMRLWSRRLKKTPLDLSDVLVIAAWLVALADLITTYIAVYWGAGLYMKDLRKYNPSGEVDIGKITYSAYFTWVFAITLIKLSILLLYRNLFRVMNLFVRLVNYTMIFQIVVFVGFIIGLLLQCRPIAYNWIDVPGGYCGLDVETSFIISGTINLIVDIWLVVLPIMPVWKLQHVSKMKRFGINAMFGLGVLICVLVGIRFQLISEIDEAEFNHDGETPGILVAMEVYLGIISACLPTVTPSLRFIKSRAQQSYLSGLLSHVRTILQTATGTRQSSGAESRFNLSGSRGMSDSNPNSGNGSEPPGKLTLGLDTTMSLSGWDTERVGGKLSHRVEIRDDDIPLTNWPINRSQHSTASVQSLNRDISYEANEVPHSSLI